MNEHATEHEVTRTGARKVLSACFVGNVVEFYDFAVYGYTAAVIAALFFPAGNPTAALLSTFALFAVAFFMRPVGGALFGNLGDKIGRRSVLAVVILMMGASTAAIGLLPTYQQIGILAPILLTVCRLVQGLSAGGELSGASSFAMEYAPRNRRGLWVASATMGTVIAFGFAALTILALTTLMPESYGVWGWRIPFLIGGVLALIGLYVRLRLNESPAFQSIAEDREVASVPVAELFREHKKKVALMAALAAFNGLAFYIIAVYFTTHMTEILSISENTALIATGVAMFLTSIIMVLSGFISDRVGRKPLMYVSAAWLALTSIPAFLVVGSGSLAVAVAAYLMLTVGLGLYLAVFNISIVEAFPTNVRYSGASISYNLGYMVFGGTAPFVATFLVSRTGFNVSPGVYMAAAAVAVLLVLALAVPETFRRTVRQGGEPQRDKTAKSAALQRDTHSESERV